MGQISDGADEIAVHPVPVSTIIRGYKSLPYRYISTIASRESLYKFRTLKPGRVTWDWPDKPSSSLLQSAAGGEQRRRQRRVAVQGIGGAVDGRPVGEPGRGTDRKFHAGTAIGSRKVRRAAGQLHGTY